jgi:glycosyltransferase involved in cell wall biosynthesis
LTQSIRVAHVTTVDLTLRFLLLPQLIRLRDEGFDVTTISAPGPWTGDLEAQGIRHIPWPHATRSWNPAADLAAFRELHQILRREKFQLVHTHNPKPSVLGRIAARLAGVPCVVNTVHGFYAAPDDRLAKRIPVLALERLAVRFSDLELYVSEEDIEWSRRMRLVSPNRSFLVRNGVNLSTFDPSSVSEDRLAELRRELGIPENAVIVGTVARLVVEKGYRELFAAAATLHTVLPDVRFLSVGPADPDKADALNQRELDRVLGSFIFTGLRQDIPSLLAVMDIFVLASWREGLPQAAIEAAAMGKPLVLTDIRGCREVVRHEVEGLLVPPRDPVRLAEGIGRLVEDPDLRKKMGAAARARAIERFDQGKIIDVIVSQYRSLLARKGILGSAGQQGDPTPIIDR